jgi:hypothetical protein
MKILHFHSNGRIGLTIASFKLENGSYILGMALAQKSDNGSRAKGREIAIMKAVEYAIEVGIPTGQCGLYEVENLETVKAIAKRIRTYEWYYGNSKKNQVYNKVFFELDKFVEEEHLGSYVDTNCEVSSS